MNPISTWQRTVSRLIPWQAGRPPHRHPTAGAAPGSVKPPRDGATVTPTGQTGPLACPRPALDCIVQSPASFQEFEPPAFLSSLFNAYIMAVAEGGNPLRLAPVMPLIDLYPWLTRLSTIDRNYSKQQFVQDIYLLHGSGINTTGTGASVSFPMSRGVPGKTLMFIDETGWEIRYYGIRFIQAP